LERTHDLLVDEAAWRYVIEKQRLEARLVFCHPDLLVRHPKASLYYRGICGLSIKAARTYCKAVQTWEESESAAPDRERALDLARAYNALICSIINVSTAWTLENGRRTILATLGITLDGVMRNKVGSIAEARVREMVVEWLAARDLLRPNEDRPAGDIPSSKTRILRDGTEVVFGSDPDISFRRQGALLAIVEIKGGTDPAGALERYGAAQKTFQHAIASNPRCRNFYLYAAMTDELKRRITEDRLVEKTFSIIKLLNDAEARRDFFREIFHHTLRVEGALDR